MLGLVIEVDWEEDEVCDWVVGGGVVVVVVVVVVVGGGL